MKINFQLEYMMNNFILIHSAYIRLFFANQMNNYKSEIVDKFRIIIEMDKGFNQICLMLNIYRVLLWLNIYFIFVLCNY